MPDHLELVVRQHQGKARSDGAGAGDHLDVSVPLSLVLANIGLVLVEYLL